ncbi:hypothetical protein H0H93_003481, partial [Arthromyces matolae]
NPKKNSSGGGQRVKKRKLDEVNKSDDDLTASSTEDGSDADPIPRMVPEFSKAAPSTSNTKHQEKSNVTNAFASFEVPVKRKKTIDPATTRNNASPVGNANTKRTAGQKKNKKKNPIVEEEEGDVDMEG